MMNVIFAGGGTGGHLYPGLAMAEALRSERPEIGTHFVGAQRGVESRILPSQGVPYTLLPLEPLRRDRVWRNWRLMPASVRSVAGLAALFRRLRPRLVVGTGGYASGPACGWAVLRRVPVALQEQNSYPGLTTRLLSRWARQVHLGFPEAADRLRPGTRTEVMVLGNPIRPPRQDLDRAESRAAFEIPTAGVVLLVVGGSQGSLALNRSLLDALDAIHAGRLPPRPEGFAMLWATGPAHIEMVRGRLAELGDPDWVRAVGYLDDMARALRAADLTLSRAGAIATAEFLAWGLPAILVPLPTAAADHQTHNARALEQAGAAVCVPESELSPQRLWSEVRRVAGNDQLRRGMAERARERGRPEAARDIARNLLQLVEGR